MSKKLEITTSITKEILREKERERVQLSREGSRKKKDVSSSETDISAVN